MNAPSTGGGKSDRPVRLVDVARAAGVHVSTASLALGERGSLLRPATRERVQEVAARLHYRPNANARALKLSTSGALGLLVPTLRNPALSPIIRGAFDRAWERGYVVLMAEDRSPEDAAAAHERLIGEGRIDGVMIASARPGTPAHDSFARGELPCVFVNRRHPVGGRNVAMREEDAGGLAARHLLELGHCRLGHIGGPAGVDTAERRLTGFVAAAAERGLAVAIERAQFDEGGAERAMSSLLAAADRPSAVFVSNVNQALGALAACRGAGVRVPADLSLITYDDDPMGEFLDPPVTAVGMPLGELGQDAVDALVDQVEGSPARDVVVATAPRLVVRGSTGPLS